jgi:hypothetical protein
MVRVMIAHTKLSQTVAEMRPSVAWLRELLGRKDSI